MRQQGDRYFDIPISQTQTRARTMVARNGHHTYAKPGLLPLKPGVCVLARTRCHYILTPPYDYSYTSSVHCYSSLPLTYTYYLHTYLLVLSRHSGDLVV